MDVANDIAPEGPHPAWAVVDEAVARARTVLVEARETVRRDDTLAARTRSILLGRIWMARAARTLER